MEAESNVQVVRRAFEALSRRDVQTLLALSSPEIEFFAPATAALTRQGRSYRGHEGIFRYLRDVGRVWEQLEIVTHDFTQRDAHHVVVTGRLRARGLGGYIMDEGVCWLVEVRGGKLRSSRPITHPVRLAQTPVGGRRADQSG